MKPLSPQTLKPHALQCLNPQDLNMTTCLLNLKNPTYTTYTLKPA